jgi:hypothetical protein
MKISLLTKIAFVSLFAMLAGCGSIMNKVQADLSQSLTASALNHDDPETVGAALPAYLLMLDASAEGKDPNADSLCAAAKLYGAYAGGFVSEPVRQSKLAARAWRYGKAGACKRDERFCGAENKPFEDLEKLAARWDEDDISTMACFAGAWAADIQARADQPDAQADAPKVRVIYERIAALEPGFNQGEAQMILGVMNSLLPPAFGGKPDVGAKHFQKALELSNQQNLMAKVLYAQYYARLMFEQELHDKLLNEVLQAGTQAKDLTLTNEIAKQRAAALLESGKDFF